MGSRTHRGERHLSSITAASLNGLRASQARLALSARSVANGGAPAPDPTGSAVEQVTAVQEFRANAKVVSTLDSVTRSTLEIWG